MTIKQQGGIFGRNPTFNNTTVDGRLDVDNIRIDGNTISTTNTNGNLVLTLDNEGSLVTSNLVGIGNSNPYSNTSSTARNLVVGDNSSASETGMTLGSTTASTIRFNDGSDAGVIEYGHSANYLRFIVNNATEAARFNSAGDLLVSKVSQDVDTDGIELRSDGVFVATADGESPIFANRKSSDGAIATFMRSGSTVGSIKCRSSGGNLQVDSIQSGIDFSGDGWFPMRNGSIVDNDLDIGSASFRFDDIYATNATIQTSDRNEKQDIAELSDAEQRVAVAAKGLIRKFRWQSAVAEKGDNARIHFGIIAQDLQDAFTAEGLDAGDYAMFTSTTWWEHTVEVPAVEAVDKVTETSVDEEGNEIVTVITPAVEARDAYTLREAYETAEEAPEGSVQKTRLGVRYPELLAFIIAAM